ncbi:MAG: sigma-70 family RNA polymerase sigma factor [Ruminococcus sp.]|nr:sigma-70 family RNA polymerase sigma factor [Ruminococcus sp.]
MTDSEIVVKMVSDPDEGFRMMFDEYHNYVYTIVYNMLRKVADSRDIEDCVVDVLSDVMMNYDHEHGGSLKAYIGTAAKHRAIDMSRSLGRTAVRNVSLYSGNVSELASDENIEETVGNSEIARQILEKIQGMGSPDSEILIQKFFFDRNSTAIARMLKMNPITVRSRCSRAVKRLKQLLADINITL